MPLNAQIRFWLKLYESAWTLALPGLALSPRLREGWRERMLRDAARGPVDLWIQAASGGEAYLALEIAGSLSKALPVDMLITSGTSQGLEILEKGRGRLSPHTRTAFFPLDIPSLMKKAIDRWRPALLVLLETELWPGLLGACREKGVPVVILNGRMSKKSLSAYLRLRKFWLQIAPDAVYAVSPEDADRFEALFGNDRVGSMKNIKFDRLSLKGSGGRIENPLGLLIPAESPFLVLGSIRKEEEGEIDELLKAVRAVLPRVVVGLFPRHMQRLEHWKKTLARTGMPWRLRSGLVGRVSPGTVILWDAFGELEEAYSRAQAAFVGGSLKPCGGQNFLEALAHGVTPCIGPHWENFAWVGRDIVRSGLVREVADRRELVQCLAQNLLEPHPREEILSKAGAYWEERKGGTEQARRVIERYL
jgi:3-deoxy-D-manno-octulosonic-acid transferase